MGVACTSCGHIIPAGQFRCGKCGGLAPRESLEDFGGLTELAESSPASSDAGPAPALAFPDDEPRPALSEPEDAPEDEPAAALHPRTEATEEPEARASRPDDEPGSLVVAAGAASKQTAAPKEGAAPKGTFASETPAAPFQHAARVVKSAAESSTVESQAVAPDRPTRSEPRVAVAAHTSSQRLRQLAAPARPPFLASEILREDLAPREPGSRTLMLALYAAGAAGFVGTLAVGYASLYGVLSAVACIALVALARVSITYTKRAGVVAALSGVSLLFAALGRLSLGASHDDAVLVLACALLPAALWFRAWYRATQLARVLVAGALTLAVTWAALTSHRGLLTLGFTWQSWLPALAWYLFCILCLLSLLAFMGDETTGGCDAWASGLSLWFALFVCLRAAMEVETFAENARAAATALGIAEAAFAVPLSVALAQLCARAFSARRETSRPR